MGICEKKVNEGYIPGSPLPIVLETTNLIQKEYCICKIKSNKLGTGFFCKLESNNKKIPVLMTNYHVIDDKYLENNKYFEVYINNNHHIININKDSKIYSSDSKHYDIMIIKINKDNKDIKNYLEIDPNVYKEGSLKTYKNESIYILHYPNCKESELYPIINKAYISYGKGIELEDQDIIYNIKHWCNTEKGSSGAPILSSLTHKVIGIHKGFIRTEKPYNIGTFLEFPLKEFEQNNNYIIAELYITDEWINKDIQIINSYEEVTKIFIIGRNLKEDEYRNENEINKCQISINDEPIPFNYFHKFKYKGKYIIKYSFMNYLTKTNQMFSDCSFLKNIDLSNFKAQEVINMEGMFYHCISLNNINLANLNTQKVNNMSNMFSGCTFLKNINLSNITTKNVINMDNMFGSCLSLKKENVIINDKRILKQLEKDLSISDYIKSLWE